MKKEKQNEPKKQRKPIEKKKIIKRILVAIGILAIIWVSMFVIDYTRCNSAKTPIFVMKGDDVDEYGGGTYYGLCYKAQFVRYYSINNGIGTSYVQLDLFGKKIMTLGGSN